MMKTPLPSSRSVVILSDKCDPNHTNLRGQNWRSLMKNAMKLSICLIAAGITLTGGKAIAQGCVAAHSNQRAFDELLDTDTGGPVSPSKLHNLTVDIGYRVFNSNKYFVGSTEIPKSSAIENHQNIFDVGIEYRLSPRWSLIADIPVFTGTRDKKQKTR